MVVARSVAMIPFASPTAPPVLPDETALLEVCSFLPAPFTVQDVVRSVSIHCPERIEGLPDAWERLRTRECILTVGLCGNAYKVVGRSWPHEGPGPNCIA